MNISKIVIPTWLAGMLLVYSCSNPDEMGAGDSNQVLPASLQGELGSNCDGIPESLVRFDEATQSLFYCKDGEWRATDSSDDDPRAAFSEHGDSDLPYSTDRESTVSASKQEGSYFCRRQQHGGFVCSRSYAPNSTPK